jgi:flavin-dependent dehydrogenase
VTAPIIVVGGGLAGAAAACLLARSGREVSVFERGALAAHKICGEFISAEARTYLERIGISLMALGAHPIGEFRLVRGLAAASCALPFMGLGLSRKVLDEALLRHAAHLGADVHRGQTVKLKRDRDPIVLDVGGGEIRAETLFLATGKHDLRGPRRHGVAPSDLVGFKLHLRLTPVQRSALSGAVELLLMPDGYAGLQPVEDGLANLCLLVDRTRLRRLDGGWDALFEDLMRTEPHLRRRLTGATAVGGPLSIYRVPFGFVHRPGSDDAPGLFRLGDQMGVIPSFTGDGMSIALHSAIMAASCYMAGAPAAVYHQRMRRDIAGQIALSGLLDRTGRTKAGQIALMRLGALWPSGLRLAARLTRLPDRAVSHLLSLNVTSDRTMELPGASA